MTVIEPLATESDFNALIGPTPPGVNIDRILTAASQSVRRFCRWHIGPSRTETFTVDGQGGDALVLKTLHLTSLTAVTNDGVTVDPTTVEWSADGYLRLSGCWWSCKLRGITVTVVHGWDLEDITDVVKIVCAIADRSARTPAGVVSESALAQSITYAQDPMGSELDALSAYRLPRRA